MTAFGTGVDQTVKRIDTAYDTGGRPFLFTSYNSATATDPVTNQLNQVQRTFNGLAQLITEAQVHGNSQAPSVSVQYAYSFVTGAGGPNHSRLTSITYPNGRVLSFVTERFKSRHSWALQNPPRYIRLPRRVGLTSSYFIRSLVACNGRFGGF